jgi:hypothetical protein
LTTPELLKANVQKYLTGLLIIFQGTSIITLSESLSLESLGESILNAESLVGNGIFLSCLILQYVINKKVMPTIVKSRKPESFEMTDVMDSTTKANESKEPISNFECHHKVNQIVSLFTAASIPNPSLMLLSMFIPTFTSMRQWNINVILGPIFVPFLYTIILIWSYGFMEISSDAYKWNIGGACIAVLMGINTIYSKDFYFTKIIEPLKPYFNQNFKILLLYMLMSWMFFVLLVTN